MNAAKRRDLLIGILLAAAAFFGALYQVNEATGADDHGRGGEYSETLPRLLCPLH